MNNLLRTQLPDGEWTCRWIGDIKYKKDKSGDGITIVSKVHYVSDDGTRTTTYPSIYTLFLAIMGMKVRVKDKLIQSFISNASQKRPHYLIKVDDEALFPDSRPIARHLNFPKDTNFTQLTDSSPSFQSLLRVLQLPPDFIIRHGHLIPNGSSENAVDYFIIPSYEILRYFFLYGSSFGRSILSYFTSPDEPGRMEMDELFLHPAGEPLIIEHENRRVAYLAVKPGLSPVEINCLGRIAFHEETYNCLEIIKESLLLSGSISGKGYDFKTLRTTLPFDAPFQLAVCGRPFEWSGKVYLLVDQIYDTQEKALFDKLMYSPFSDFRSQAVLPHEAKVTYSTPTASKTVLGSKSQLTDEQAGGGSQIADLSVLEEHGFSFGEKPLPVKLDKTGQTNRHKRRASEEIEYELNSVLEQINAGAGLGRTNLHRVDGSTQERFVVLEAAIGLIQGYSCTYFNVDEDKPFFRRVYHLNARGRNRPYSVLLCRFVPINDRLGTSVYLVWAEKVRYAIFHAADIGPISLTVLAELCNRQFSQHGVTRKLIHDEIKAYRRRNPKIMDESKLAGRIKAELDNIVDDLQTGLH